MRVLVSVHRENQVRFNHGTGVNGAYCDAGGSSGCYGTFPEGPKADVGGCGARWDRTRGWDG